MDVPTTCPGCGGRLLVDAALVGRPARCGVCGRVFVAEPTPASPPPFEVEPPPPFEVVPTPEPPPPYVVEPPPFGFAPPYRRPPPRGGTANASLVIGLIANLTWCIPVFGLPLGVVAVVLGWPDWPDRRGPPRPYHGRAVVGTVLGGIAAALGFAWGVVLLISVVTKMHHPD